MEKTAVFLGGYGRIGVYKVNVLKAHMRHLLKSRPLSLLPSLQCLDNNPYQTGGLVIKEVTIPPITSPLGQDISHPFKESVNLSLITHYTINRYTVRFPPYGVMLRSPQTSKPYPL